MTTGPDNTSPRTAMTLNAAMTPLLEARTGAAEIFVPSPFRLLVFGGFKDVDGCVLLAQLFKDDHVSEIALTRYQDRTGVECTINKIHLEDFLEPGMAREAPSLALVALECANFLAGHLGTKLPGYSFRIIVSVDDRVCTMRFHKLRDGEIWLDDIAGYEEEALFVIDIPSGSPL